MAAPEKLQEELVHLNGRLVPTGEARISAFDYGFLYGYGLFETMRAYDGVIFRLEEHVERLKRSAVLLGFSSALDGCDLMTACVETVSGNGLRDARVRLTVTPGEGYAAGDIAACKVPTVLVVARQYAQPAAVYEKGFAAVICPWRRNSRSAITRCKSVSYAENLLARMEATRAGAQEALFLNERGLLAEGSMSNTFVVKAGVVATPSLESGLLPGIARSDVVGLCRSLGIGVEERGITREELSAADEAFLTNSLVEVMPLTRVDGRPIGGGRPGAVTQRLLAAYRELVDRVVGRL